MCIRDRYQRRVHGIVTISKCKSTVLSDTEFKKIRSQANLSNQFIDQSLSSIEQAQSGDAPNSNYPRYDSATSSPKYYYALVEKEDKLAEPQAEIEMGEVESAFPQSLKMKVISGPKIDWKYSTTCLLYTSPSPRDLSTSRMPSSA
eukprot:TRINITY_DN6844_c0_g1_i1.p1 TRINITY_DN6844_c0_g1~~TRINITY_DN6844_c0_g1_i1.p1  ORF type:complete len:146 (+),score=37.39 TRINITY_DN6844_c0_g1_i1:132-569(+)